MGRKSCRKNPHLRSIILTWKDPWGSQWQKVEDGLCWALCNHTATNTQGIAALSVLINSSHGFDPDPGAVSPEISSPEPPTNNLDKVTLFEGLEWALLT